jgi:hypothetical protein
MTFIAPSILNDSFAGQSILGLKSFSFNAQNTSLHALLAFKISIEKSAVILMGLPLCYLFFTSYSLQYSFFILCACCFNDNMSWESSILVKSVWFSEGFLYLNGHKFLEIWEIFCYYLIAYIMNTFCLDLFSFFNAHDFQACSLYEVSKSCIFLSQVLSCLTNSSSVFPLISILSLSSEILSSTWSSLLKWSSTVFFFSGSLFWSFLYHGLLSL